MENNNHLTLSLASVHRPHNALQTIKDIAKISSATILSASLALFAAKESGLEDWMSDTLSTHTATDPLLIQESGEMVRRLDAMIIDLEEKVKVYEKLEPEAINSELIFADMKACRSILELLDTIANYQEKMATADASLSEKEKVQSFHFLSEHLVNSESLKNIIIVYTPQQRQKMKIDKSKKVSDVNQRLWNIWVKNKRS